MTTKPTYSLTKDEIRKRLWAKYYQVKKIFPDKQEKSPLETRANTYFGQVIRQNDISITVVVTLLSPKIGEFVLPHKWYTIRLLPNEINKFIDNNIIEMFINETEQKKDVQVYDFNVS